MFFLGKCVRTVAKTMVVDRKNTKALACLASGPPPNAANSSNAPIEFAEGDQLSVPYVVPTMSVLRIDCSRFFYCYASYVTFHIFRFTKCFCFAAERKSHRAVKTSVNSSHDEEALPVCQIRLPRHESKGAWVNCFSFRYQGRMCRS